jgi:hypothetical protein
MRVRRLSQLVVGLTVASVAAVAPGGPASADPACRYAERRVFAVAADGRLHELVRCADAPTVEDLGVVDGGAWRAHLRVTAAVDGATTTFWTVGADGRLVRRIQAVPGAALGPAEVVESGRDWSPVRSLVAAPHALLMDYAPSRRHVPPPPPPPAPPSPSPPTPRPWVGRSSTMAYPPWAFATVRVFTPTNAGLVEVEPLFRNALGPALTSVSDGFGETISGNVHRRVWRINSQGGDNPGRRSGTLPDDLHGFAGDEDFLGGLDANGRIAVLRQDWRQPEPPYHDPMVCPFNRAPFTPYATSTSTGWIRLVVPGRADPGAVSEPPLRWDDCPDDGPGSRPWEWQ